MAQQQPARCIILIRHGNTFDGSEPVVWVGRNEDLPLAPSGLLQAQALGEVFRKLDLTPAEVYSSPLQRALMTASELGRPVQVLTELNEIDYGLWGGLSDGEIRGLGYAQALEAWDKEGLIPEDGIWGSSHQEIETQISCLFETLKRLIGKSGLVVAITSNGILKLLYKTLNRDQPLLKPPKVRTGHICVLTFDNEHLRIELWNASPDEFFMWKRGKA